MARKPYRQALPEIGLAIECGTDSVPPDGAFYLIRNGEAIGRFRTLKAAQEAWRETIRELGWKPTPRATDATEVLRREQSERWSRNRAG
jgi:hypothetical protein